MTVIQYYNGRENAYLHVKRVYNITTFRNAIGHSKTAIPKFGAAWVTQPWFYNVIS